MEINLKKYEFLWDPKKEIRNRDTTERRYKFLSFEIQTGFAGGVCASGVCVCVYVCVCVCLCVWEEYSCLRGRYKLQRHEERFVFAKRHWHWKVRLFLALRLTLARCECEFVGFCVKGFKLESTGEIMLKQVRPHHIGSTVWGMGRNSTFRRATT